MPPRFLRLALLVVGVALAFVVSIAVMMQLIPAPRRSVDYMIIGGAATFAAMAVLFVVMITTWYRMPAGIVRRRVASEDTQP